MRRLKAAKISSHYYRAVVLSGAQGRRSQDTASIPSKTMVPATESRREGKSWLLALFGFFSLGFLAERVVG